MTSAWLDQQDALVTEHIRRFGWHVEYVVTGRDCGETGCGGCQVDEGDVDGEESCFAYTVGLFGMNHPELLVHGVSPHTASAILGELGDRVRGGSNILPREVLELQRVTRRIVAEPVPNPGEIVYTANRHYRRPSQLSVPVLQITWDDVNGRFPWEAGYSLPDWMQPRPGMFRA